MFLLGLLGSLLLGVSLGLAIATARRRYREEREPRPHLVLIRRGSVLRQPKPRVEFAVMFAITMLDIRIGGPIVAPHLVPQGSAWVFAVGIFLLLMGCVTQVCFGALGVTSLIEGLAAYHSDPPRRYTGSQRVREAVFALLLFVIFTAGLWLSIVSVYP